jgi:hypothetical protein
MLVSRSRCCLDVRWCLESGAALELIPGDDTGAWRTAFDQVADELRAARAGRPMMLVTARSAPVGGHGGRLVLRRGLLAESQRRYEQAACTRRQRCGRCVT